MNKHTPGPWLTYQDEPDIVANLQPHAAGICRMYYVDASETELNAEVRANARLIAAAPELLAALKRAQQVLAFLHHFGLSREETIDKINKHLPAIDAAIAKATGERP